MKDDNEPSHQSFAEAFADDIRKVEEAEMAPIRKRIEAIGIFSGPIDDQPNTSNNIIYLDDYRKRI